MFGGTLKVHVDAAGDLTAVNGTIVPAIDLSTNPRLSAGRQGERCRRQADPDGERRAAKLKANNLRAESSQLQVYRTGLIKGEAGTNELVYQVVGDQRLERPRRRVRRRQHRQGRSTATWSTTRSIASSSSMSGADAPDLGGRRPVPGRLNGDQQNIVNFSGDSYHFFFNAFGRDSYDAAGAHMRSVNNDPTIRLPERQLERRDHELLQRRHLGRRRRARVGPRVHASTRTDLIYQWQPGALNESYSDIWGETVDLINGAGTDVAGHRSHGRRVLDATPAPAILVINSPASIAQDCGAAAASSGRR